MSKKAKEFIEKVRELEKEYQMMYAPEDPFTYMLVIDKDFYYDQDGDKVYDRAKNKWIK